MGHRLRIRGPRDRVRPAVLRRPCQHAGRSRPFEEQGIETRRPGTSTSATTAVPPRCCASGTARSVSRAGRHPGSGDLVRGTQPHCHRAAISRSSGRTGAPACTGRVSRRPTTRSRSAGGHRVGQRPERGEIVGSESMTGGQVRRGVQALAHHGAVGMFRRSDRTEVEALRRRHGAPAPIRRRRRRTAKLRGRGLAPSRPRRPGPR